MHPLPAESKLEDDHPGKGPADTMSDTEYEGKGVIAERLDQLFATVTPEGRPYTLKEAAEGINAKAGEPLVSVQYLSQLRKGDRREPSRKVLTAIADWFGVHLNYFTNEDDVSRTDEELRAVAMLRDADVRDVMFRANGISRDGLHLVKAMLDRIRASEGLPSAPADDEPGSTSR